MKFWPRRPDAVDEEIRGHIEMAVRDRMERGESRAQAEAAVRREFGDVVVVKEVTRDMDGRVWLTRLGQDLRYAARLLRRSPGFTVVAVLSLALGIGAATAIFQIVDAVRLRSLPVARPWELARVRIVNMDGARGNRTSPYDPLNYPVFEQIRRQQQGFTDVAAWSGTSFNLADGGEMRPARGLFVSGTFFNVLGIAPAAGRLIADADDTPGCAPRVVLSHAFWTREMGGDPHAIGRTLTLDSRQAEVIGVTPAGFSGLEVGRGFDVAVPLCVEPAIERWQPAHVRDRLVARGDRPSQARVDARARHRAAAGHLPRHLRGHDHPDVSGRQRAGLQGVHARSGAGRRRRLDAAPGVRASALDAARGGGHRAARSRARTSRTCCSRAPARGTARSRSASASGPRARASSGSC